jgi:hypothetical protein
MRKLFPISVLLVAIGLNAQSPPLPPSMPQAPDVLTAQAPAGASLSHRNSPRRNSGAF